MKHVDAIKNVLGLPEGTYRTHIYLGKHAGPNNGRPDKMVIHVQLSDGHRQVLHEFMEDSDVQYDGRPCAGDFYAHASLEQDDADVRLVILYEWITMLNRPVTVGEVMAKFSLTRKTARHCLERLVDLSLVFYHIPNPQDPRSKPVGYTVENFRVLE